MYTTCTFYTVQYIDWEEREKIPILLFAGAAAAAHPVSNSPVDKYRIPGKNTNIFYTSIRKKPAKKQTDRAREKIFNSSCFKLFFNRGN